MSQKPDVAAAWHILENSFTLLPRGATVVIAKYDRPLRPGVPVYAITITGAGFEGQSGGNEALPALNAALFNYHRDLIERTLTHAETS